MNNKYEEQLGTGRILPLVFKMALPAVAAQFVDLPCSITDRVYTGHIPGIGTDALAGVGATTSLITLISSFLATVDGGGAPLAAIVLEQGDRVRAGRILESGFVLLILFTSLTSVITYTFMEPILLLMGASESTLEYAIDYLSIYLLRMIFVKISTRLNSLINAQGCPAIVTSSVLIRALLDVVPDPIFIFWFDVGVKGAALTTVSSQACSAVWVVSFLFPRRASLSLGKRYMGLDRRTVLSILALGISPFIMVSTESLAGSILNSSLREFGGIYISALTVLQSSMQFASVPLTGFARGFVLIISYNFGHGNKQRVEGCFRIVLVTISSFNLILMLSMILFPSTVASAFTSDEKLIETVRWTMPAFLGGMTIFGLRHACRNMFTALEQTRISTFIALLRKTILLIPLALILPNFVGVAGVYAAEAISNATATICCTLLFFWQSPKILGRIKGNTLRVE